MNQTNLGFSWFLFSFFPILRRPDKKRTVFFMEIAEKTGRLTRKCQLVLCGAMPSRTARKFAAEDSMCAACAWALVSVPSVPEIILPTS
jgi:hypothetical protein